MFVVGCLLVCVLLSVVRCCSLIAVACCCCLLSVCRLLLAPARRLFVICCLLRVFELAVAGCLLLIVACWLLALLMSLLVQLLLRGSELVTLPIVSGHESIRNSLGTHKTLSAIILTEGVKLCLGSAAP